MGWLSLDPNKCSYPHNTPAPVGYETVRPFINASVSFSIYIKCAYTYHVRFCDDFIEYLQNRDTDDGEGDIKCCSHWGRHEKRSQKRRRYTFIPPQWITIIYLIRIPKLSHFKFQVVAPPLEYSTPEFTAFKVFKNATERGWQFVERRYLRREWCVSTRA